MVAQHDRGREPVVRDYWSHYVDVVAPCVCARCNNGWMNVLDQDAQPLLASLVSSLERHALAPEDQRRSATWAMKVALVLDYAVTTSHPDADPSPLGIVQPSVRQRLYDDRLPLPDTYVWLAAQNTAEPLILSLAGGKQGPPPNLLGTPLLGEKRHRMYVATFRVNHAIFQVFVPDPDSRWVPIRGGFDDAVIQLWPPTFRTSYWPPSSLIDENEDMEALHRSLGSMPTIL